MALTATATLRVREDIVHVLGLGKSRRGDYYSCVNTFHRENLFFAVHHTKTANLVNLEADLSKYISFPSSHGMPLSRLGGAAVRAAFTGLGGGPSGHPAARAATAATARAAGGQGTGTSGTPRHHFITNSTSAQVGAKTGFNANANIRCPMCDVTLSYPHGSSPDMVVGAHLDAGCGTSPEPAEGGQVGSAEMRGGGASSSRGEVPAWARGNGASHSGQVRSIKDDDDVPLSQLTPAKRSRQIPSQLLGRPGTAIADTITISDSDESSDEDEIHIIDEKRNFEVEQGANDESDDSAPLIQGAADVCGGGMMPVDEELAALQMLEEEIARQRHGTFLLSCYDSCESAEILSLPTVFKL